MSRLNRREFLTGAAALSAYASLGRGTDGRICNVEPCVGCKVDDLGYTARDYVQDGLIAMWDGIENVGFDNPRDSSSLIWRDLVGERNAVLTEKGRFTENYFECLGGGCAAYFTPDNVSRSEITIEIGGSDFNGCRVLDISDGGNYKKSIWGDVLNGKANNLRMSWSNGGTRIKNQIPILQGFHTYSATLSGFRTSASHDVLYHSWRDGSDADSILTNGYFGEWPGGGGFGGVNPSSSQTSFPYPASCKILFVRYYGRHLSSNEIAANYAIDKSRFNLT